MLTPLVALFLGFLLFADLRGTCLTRHAVPLALLPLAGSLLPFGLAALGVHVSVSFVFNGLPLIDLVGLGFAVGGFVLARRLAPRYRAAFERYWDSLA